MGYSWDWGKISTLFIVKNENTLSPGALILGLGLTLKITVYSLLLTAVFGLGTALARLIGGPVLRGTARGYLELVRNTPLLIQLFFLYFILGPILGLPRLWAAILALSLFEGAYLAEIIRSGILAVPAGQWQAAWCLGLSTRQTLTLLILPQAGRMLLPALCNQTVSLLKDSALVSTVALYDLTQMARASISENFLTFETWFLVAAIYLCLALIISTVSGWLEKKLNR